MTRRRQWRWQAGGNGGGRENEKTGKKPDSKGWKAKERAKKEGAKGGGRANGSQKRGIPELVAAESINQGLLHSPWAPPALKQALQGCKGSLGITSSRWQLVSASTIRSDSSSWDAAAQEGFFYCLPETGWPVPSICLGGPFMKHGWLLQSDPSAALDVSCSLNSILIRV